MSIINVVNHNETIYNIIHDYNTPIIEQKSPNCLAISKYMKNKAKLTNQKKEADIEIDEGTHKHRGCLADAPLPPIPKYSPREQNDKPCINFRVKNIKSALHLLPRPVTAKCVDSQNGHLYEDSCLKLMHVFKHKYGKIPQYLAKQNHEMEKSEEQYQEYLDTKKTLCTKITEEERQELLNGLMQNWAEVQKAFHLLPIQTDTTPKVIKKKKMEDHLKKLEKDIEMLKSHPFIYIYE